MAFTDGASVTQDDKFLMKELFPMSVAFLAAKRSKDEQTKVGACIVDDENRILGYGYNGHPFTENKGVDTNNDELFSWDREDKHKYVCHAERNAIDFKTGSVHGATMFVTLYPCNECAKTIVQNKIQKLVYWDQKDSENIKLEDSKFILENSLRIKPIKFNEYLKDVVGEEKALKGIEFLNSMALFLDERIRIN